METATIIKAFILGLVEGITEFLPVSSTGHLIFIGEMMRFNGPPGKVFEIVIQLGAILAICWLYRKKLFHAVIDCRQDRSAQRFIIAITLAFIPSAILGAIFHDFIKEVIFNPKVVAFNLVLGGFIILWIEKKHHPFVLHTIESLPHKTALYIGFAQCIAMIPGVSRSGATIMGGMLLGVDRKAATEFSFFLAIPTMLGATGYDIFKNYHLLDLDNMRLILIGFVVAFFSALVVVRFFVQYISHHNFVPFAYYRIAAGLVMGWMCLEYM